MFRLSGQVINSNVKDKSGKYETLPSAEVFVSDEIGVITPKRFGTTTDVNGNFVLELPYTVVSGIPVPLVDGLYLTAKYGNKKVTQRLTNKSVYNFDVADSPIREIQEVLITAKRPLKTGSESEDDKRRRLKLYGQIALVSTLILIPGIALLLGFYIDKNSKK